MWSVSVQCSAYHLICHQLMALHPPTHTHANTCLTHLLTAKWGHFTDKSQDGEHMHICFVGMNWDRFRGIFGPWRGDWPRKVWWLWAAKNHTRLRCSPCMRRERIRVCKICQRHTLYFWNLFHLSNECVFIIFPVPIGVLDIRSGECKTIPKKSFNYVNWPFHSKLTVGFIFFMNSSSRVQKK